MFGKKENEIAVYNLQCTVWGCTKLRNETKYYETQRNILKGETKRNATKRNEMNTFRR
jgi:hypothetical protein